MSGKSKAKENFYLSEGNKNKKRGSSNVPSSSCSHKRSPKTKRRHSDIHLDWDKAFKDNFITDIEVADLENRIQVESPFAFGK
jgi:hypothetical protein